MARKKEVVPIEHYHVRLGNRGRLVLPSKLRRRMGVQDGDRMILTVDPDGTTRLASVREVVQRLAGSWAHLEPRDVSWSDELIRERREEARREARKYG
jgi:AbrB family looped-hinge helix DNA binding protein